MRRRLLVTTAVALLLAPAARAYVPGIDVSHFNGSVDWARVAGAGYKFAYVKATEGNTLDDAPYAAYRAGAAASKLRFGAYHFARPQGATTGVIEVDAVAEADHFVDVAQPRPGDLLPVLDLEATGGLASSALSIWTLTWLHEVEARLHVKPIIYTSPHFWQTALANTSFFAASGYRYLWVAHYTSAPVPNVPAQNWGGHGWTFWQWSDCGRIPGITGCVDKDRFSGASFAPVTIPALPSNTYPPTISGLASPGQKLTASSGTWSGTQPISFAYRWQRCDAAASNCADIPNATGPAYTVAPADIGQRLLVVVTARNAAGTTTVASAPTAVVTDTTPPTIPAFSTLGQRFQRQVRFAVAWTASDAGTGVGSYDVRYRSAPYNGAFGLETAWLSSTSATNATFVGSPGTTYCFSARASDRAGNVSGWSNETCTALPVDDRTLTVASAPWARRVAAGYYNGTYSSSVKAGAALVLHNIQARRLALLANRCPACGAVQVFWNGRLIKAVTLTAPALQKRQLVAIGSFSAVQNGTVRVRVSSSGRPVQIDALGVTRA